MFPSSGTTSLSYPTPRRATRRTCPVILRTAAQWVHRPYYSMYILSTRTTLRPVYLQTYPAHSSTAHARVTAPGYTPPWWTRLSRQRLQYLPWKATQQTVSSLCAFPASTRYWAHAAARLSCLLHRTREAARLGGLPAPPGVSLYTYTAAHGGYVELVARCIPCCFPWGHAQCAFVRARILPTPVSTSPTLPPTPAHGTMSTELAAPGVSDLAEPPNTSDGLANEPSAATTHDGDRRAIQRDRHVLSFYCNTHSTQRRMPSTAHPTCPVHLWLTVA
ncbi:uncharacterized protein B0H18DRAFT_36147 [Fomitopsis serialis]|uniref:uncharacterized protein n=1 Tax=Fomitopsis serialis TaxID=139415 RepID=UPI002008D1AA|nr:uncharacterized protein B0H18DRAFT_36147 [Neoantrodia serialis]KAH9917416.1 hypothetical protein B0H18DRAFT_36147 [Neoantrodia serialis]